MKARISLTVVATATVLLVAGCGSTSGTVTSSAPQGINASASLSAVARPATASTTQPPITSTSAANSAEPASSDSANATTTDSASESGELKFGSTYTWDDGLSVTVSKGVPFKPSQYAAVGKKAAAYLKYTITIVNKTGKPYDPALFTTSVQSGDKEAEKVYDSEGNLGLPPSTKVLNGRQSTFTVGFGVSDPKDIVMEVSPGFDYESILYSSAGSSGSESALTTAAATKASGPADSGDLKFGQTYTWEDGLSVTVSKGVPFKPSEYAAVGKKAAAYLQYTITILNKTGKYSACRPGPSRVASAITGVRPRFSVRAGLLWSSPTGPGARAAESPPAGWFPSPLSLHWW